MVGLTTLLVIYLLIGFICAIACLSACIVGKRADDVRRGALSISFRCNSDKARRKVAPVYFRTIRYRQIGTHHSE